MPLESYTYSENSSPASCKEEFLSLPKAVLVQVRHHLVYDIDSHKVQTIYKKACELRASS